MSHCETLPAKSPKKHKKVLKFHRAGPICIIIMAMNLILIFAFALVTPASFSAAPDGPPVTTSEILDDDLNRMSYYGLIINYLEKAAIYNIAEHFSYLQSKDTSSLALTKARQDELLAMLDKLHRIQRIKPPARPAVNVTCTAPAGDDDSGSSE